MLKYQYIDFIDENVPHDKAEIVGKSKYYSELLVKNFNTLRIKQGYYKCPVDGLIPHYWTESVDGNIVDPTSHQFISIGTGEYLEIST